VSSLAPYESSIAERYHEETKYSEDRLRAQAGSRSPLDFTEQPVPFRKVLGARVHLPTEGLPLERREDAIVAEVEEQGDGEMDLAKLARILWHTNGCTRIVRHAHGIHHFRAAPSAGAMYPTEVYVACRGVPSLPDGVYDYHLLDHSLALVHAGDAFRTLEEAAFGDPAIFAAQAVVLLTGEWYRSSWRYQERGYRRALLDTGHVLGNLVECAPVEGFVCTPIGTFRDEPCESLLQVDPVTEGLLALVPLVPVGARAGLATVPQRRSPITEWHEAVRNVGDRVDEDKPERLIAALHLAGRIERGAEVVRDERLLECPPPPDALEIDASIGPTMWETGRQVTETIATRRSTRRFLPMPIGRDPLLRALAHAFEADQVRLFAPELLRTYVVGMSVEGVPPGSYLYEQRPGRLYELSRGQMARAMHHLGLGQQIFVHAAAAIVHTVDLTRAVERYGDRAYRLVHLDAGHVGERLTLALLAEGIGVSGCGGYYDDEMNRVLQIPESQAIVYITAIGMSGDGPGV
jgi:SagB-type dehydrogenase family enzyme